MNNVTKRVGYVATVIALAMPAMGCPQMLPVITEIATAIADAGQWIDIISAAARIFFALRPNAELEQKVNAKIGQARLALNAALRTTHGAKALGQSDVDAAFADFRAAYKELIELTQSAGIVAKDGTVSVNMGTSAPVRVPVLLAESVKVK